MTERQRVFNEHFFFFEYDINNSFFIVNVYHVFAHFIYHQCLLFNYIIKLIGFIKHCYVND